jgi:hypothetical protein
MLAAGFLALIGPAAIRMQTIQTMSADETVLFFESMRNHDRIERTTI